MALSRKFIDSDGIHWQVYELSDDTAVRDQSWLYFFSRSVTICRSASPSALAIDT